MGQAILDLFRQRGDAMNVCVRILFESPGQNELASMRSLARRLTDSPEDVRVFASDSPGWLVAEFSMPTEAQYKAVEKVDRAIRFWASDPLDSVIGFPKSETEQARARRKAERRRNRRRAT
jgi:hypothetical protein